MGAWGLGPFENDDAVDFLAEFEDDQSFSFLRRAIENVITDDVLEIGAIREAVAALEIISAINEECSDDFPELESFTLEELVEKYEAKVTNTILSLCEDALAMICRLEDNMLVEVLDNEGLLEDWLETIEDLAERLL